MKSQVTAAQSLPNARNRIWFLLPVLFLLLVTVGAFVWWRHFKTTPSYSLAVLVDAARRDDVQAFDKVFDSDRVVDSFLADLTQRSESGVFGSLPISLRDRIKSTPTIVNYLKKGIREGVRRRINELDPALGNSPLVVTALALYFKTNFRVEGDRAIVSIIRNDQRLELGMLRTGDSWRVVSAKDDALATRIIANMAKDLPNEFSPLDLATPLKDALPKLPLIP